VFYYDPQKVSEFLDDIARGFIASPLQYVLFAAILLALAAGLLIAYRAQRAKARRLQGRLELERYERLARKLGLDTAESELLDRLADGQAARKLRLLASPAAFNRAAGRLLGREAAAGESALADLRLKLGFQARNPERAPTASSELPEGQPILVSWSPHSGYLPAEVRTQEADALVLAVRQGAELPPPGSRVLAVFQNRAGLFSFDTSVLSAGGGLLRLEQVEGLKRTQRRKYYRRRLRLPVSVQAGGAALTSQLLDLGGEGASLLNPQKQLAAGDLLELRFRLAGETFELTAEVLRASHNSQVLHVRFPGLRETERDRLLRVLFGSLGDAAR
jgi:hypothetical protein